MELTLLVSYHCCSLMWGFPNEAYFQTAEPCWMLKLVYVYIDR